MVSFSIDCSKSSEWLAKLCNLLYICTLLGIHPEGAHYLSTFSFSYLHNFNFKLLPMQMDLQEPKLTL